MRVCHCTRSARLTRSSSGEGEGATPLPAGRGPVWAKAHPMRVCHGPRSARLTRSSSGEGEGASARRRSPPGEARYGPKQHVCVCHGPRSARLTRSSSGEGEGASARRRSPPGEARYGQKQHVRVCHGPRSARLTRSSSGRGESATPLSTGPEHHACACPGPRAAWLTCSCIAAAAMKREGTTSLPAGRGPVWAGAPRARVPRPARCSAGAGQQRSRGGRDAVPARPGHHARACHGPRAARLTQSSCEEKDGRDAASRRARPGMGQSNTYVCAPALALLGWRGAAAEKERARRRSPPGEARYGPEHHMRVCHCPRSARLDAEQQRRRGWRDAAPRWARPGLGLGTT